MFGKIVAPYIDDARYSSRPGMTGIAVARLEHRDVPPHGKQPLTGGEPGEPRADHDRAGHRYGRSRAARYLRLKLCASSSFSTYTPWSNARELTPSCARSQTS